MTVVKVCGITEVEQACCALEAGADLLGFVLAPSRRQLTPEAAGEIVESCRRRFPRIQRSWQAVGVFASQPLGFVQKAAVQAGIDCIQLSGQEPPGYCRELALPVYKVVHIPEVVGLVQRYRGEVARTPVELEGILSQLAVGYGATRLLLDSGGAGRWGGTGVTFPWEKVGRAARHCLVAGGLTPSNVARAIAVMQPWGVDVSSGVESDGRKDLDLIRRFIIEAKRG